MYLSLYFMLYNKKGYYDILNFSSLFTWDHAFLWFLVQGFGYTLLNSSLLSTGPSVYFYQNENCLNQQFWFHYYDN